MAEYSIYVQHRSSQNGKMADGMESPKSFYGPRLLTMDADIWRNGEGKARLRKLPN